MQEIILLNYYENLSKIENEEKFRFIINLLKNINSKLKNENIEQFLNNELTGFYKLSINDKIKFRKLLLILNVQIKENKDGIRVYVGENLIGEWFGCTYSLKRDLNISDPKRQLYLEVTTNFWTPFEG